MIVPIRPGPSNNGDSEFNSSEFMASFTINLSPGHFEQRTAPALSLEKEFEISLAES